MPVHRLAIALIVITASPFAVRAQAIPVEKANDARIDSLLKQMTLEEKLDLIRGTVEPAATNQGQAGYLPGVPRLGIPPLRMADGPPGVLTRVAGQAQTATMGVAATWSTQDAELNGVIIGKQARSLGIDVVLQPFINIDRDITSGRNYNTFGEDPFLSGEMGAAEIRGEQAQDVMSQAKHFVGYDSDSYNVFIDPQTLHEVYVAPFAAAVRAGVASVMCSYNKINGAFACNNPDTLIDILRNQLGFKGFVTSDWGALHNVHFLNKGLTMEMPGQTLPGSPFSAIIHNYFFTKSRPVTSPEPPDMSALIGVLGGSLPEEPKPDFAAMGDFPTEADPQSMADALADHTITEATITTAARRVLYEIDRFGYLDGKQKHTVTAQDLNGNGAIIRKTAEDSAVLLKNEGGILPLKPSDLSKLAMVGPTAGQIDAIGTFGERSPGRPEREIGPLAALRTLAPGARVTYAVADDMTGKPVPPEMLSHGGQPGLLRTDASGATSVDPGVNFTKASGNPLPPNTIGTWTGSLIVPVSGEYWLYLQALGTRAMLLVDGKEVSRTGASLGTVHGDVQHATQDNVVSTTDGLDDVRHAVQLSAGSHDIQIKITPDTSNAPVQVRLNWTTPESRRVDHDAAIAAAKSARVAVVFAWTRDKPKFGLPGDQNALIEEIAAVNPNTVVVLNTSQPIAMPWADHVKAILEMWWPGDEGGWATASTLLGKSNPAGRLPMTWARQLQDYPATAPGHPERTAKGVDGKTTYSEGLLVGYRWFDNQKIEPLYPFGYGLSYTTFSMSSPAVTRRPDGSADVMVRVKNMGKVVGDEVTQVYLEAPASKPAGAQFAPKTLASFQRVTLKPNEERTLTLHVASRAFEYWSEQNKSWMRVPGPRVMRIGDSSANLPLSVDCKN